MSEPSNIARQRAAGRRAGSPTYLARRAEIVQAAGEVFRARGYRGTTLTHIAEALDTDRASLYSYVSGKQELFEELVGDATSANVARAAAIRDGPGSGADRLRRLIRTLIESHDDFYPVLFVLLQENLASLESELHEWAAEMRRVIRDWEQIVVDIVTAGQRDGSLTERHPAWLVAHAISGMLSWTNRWFVPGGELGADEVGDAFASMVLDGLQAGRPSPPRSR